MSGIGLFVSTDEPIKLNVGWDLCCPLVMDSHTHFSLANTCTSHSFKMVAAVSHLSIPVISLEEFFLPDSSHQPQGAKQEDTRD